MLHLVALLALCVSRSVRSFAGPVHGFRAGALTLSDQAQVRRVIVVQALCRYFRARECRRRKFWWRFSTYIASFFTLCGEKGKPRPGTRLPEVKKAQGSLFSVQGTRLLEVIPLSGIPLIQNSGLVYGSGYGSCLVAPLFFLIRCGRRCTEGAQGCSNKRGPKQEGEPPRCEQGFTNSIEVSRVYFWGSTVRPER